MKELNEIHEEVCALYNEDVELDEIAQMLNISRALVESILVSEYRIYFR